VVVSCKCSKETFVHYEIQETVLLAELLSAPLEIIGFMELFIDHDSLSSTPIIFLYLLKLHVVPSTLHYVYTVIIQ